MCDLGDVGDAVDTEGVEAYIYVVGVDGVEDEVHAAPKLILNAALLNL